MAKKKKQQIKNKYKSNGIYITMPKIVLDNQDLNPTDKLILALIHGYKSTWNNVQSSTISDYLNLEIDTINTSIRKLVFLELLEQRYYAGRKRSYRSLLEKTTDAAAIITDTILADKTISNTVKITLGTIVSASTGKNNSSGGFDFNNIDSIAERLGVHKSTIYRHLATLKESQYIEREHASYFIRVLDPYVRNHTFNVKSQQQLESNQLYPDELPPGVTPEEVDASLERIYNSL